MHMPPHAVISFGLTGPWDPISLVVGFWRLVREFAYPLCNSKHVTRSFTWILHLCERLVTCLFQYRLHRVFGESWVARRVWAWRLMMVIGSNMCGGNVIYSSVSFPRWSSFLCWWWRTSSFWSCSRFWHVIVAQDSPNTRLRYLKIHQNFRYILHPRSYSELWEIWLDLHEG